MHVKNIRNEGATDGHSLQLAAFQKEAEGD